MRSSSSGRAVTAVRPVARKRYITSSQNPGTDRGMAEVVYAGGAAMPRKPYPCVEGIKKTMELFDSNEMRKYKPEDFYHDTLLREIDASGFIDALYARLAAR
jgi:hypothetical protein